MKIAPVKISLLLFLLALCGTSCSLFADFRKSQFDPVAGAKPISLRIPKGFTKREWITDSAGFKTLRFLYPEGQELYFSTNTGLSTWIDTAQHQPRLHVNGGVFYKGVLPPLKFWREVYSQQLRFGYKNVSLDAAPDFDSALNYVRVY